MYKSQYPLMFSVKVFFEHVTKKLYAFNVDLR